MINFYEIIGLDPTASLSEIKDAIKITRKTARKRSNHSDTKIRHEAEVLIEQLAEAEKIFQDEATRNRYDNELIEFNNRNKSFDNSQYNYEDSSSSDQSSDNEELINKFKKVQKYLDRGQVDLANRALEDIKTNEPIFLKYKGEILIKLGKITDALYEFDNYIDTNRRNPELFFEVSDILSENGYNQEAIQCLVDASEYTSGYSLYSRLGKAYADIKQYDRAIECFNSVNFSGLDMSQSSHINYCLAFCYNRKRSYSNAITFADRSLNENNTNYNAIYEKIFAYDRLGRLIEIEDLVERSYINFPNFEEFTYYVLKVRVFKGTLGMTKIRANNLSILSTINNLDYIVASKEDLEMVQMLKNNILPLLHFDESGAVKNELKYIDSQINYANEKVKYDVGKYKWVFYILILYILFIVNLDIVIKLILLIILGVVYYKLTNISGYAAIKKRNQGRIVKK